MARRKVGELKVSATVAKDVAVTGVKLRARHDGWTEARQRRFLQTLAMSGCVRDAARVAGMSNQAGYRLRKKSPEFAAAWDRAIEQSVVGLRAVAYARAVEGVEEPIIRDGKVVATKRSFSDPLLLQMLKQAEAALAARPALTPEKLKEIEEAAYRRGREDQLAKLAMDKQATRRFIEERLSEMNRRMGGDG